MIHVEFTRMDRGSQQKVRIALGQIASWTPDERDAGTYIFHPDNSAWHVKESYDEVTEKIAQATRGAGAVSRGECSYGFPGCEEG